MLLCPDGGSEAWRFVSKARDATTEDSSGRLSGPGGAGAPDAELGPGLVLHVPQQSAHPGILRVLPEEGLGEEVRAMVADLGPEFHRLGHVRIDDLGLDGPAREV